MQKNKSKEDKEGEINGIFCIIDVRNKKVCKRKEEKNEKAKKVSGFVCITHNGFVTDAANGNGGANTGIHNGL